jgi:hypothetical protein
MLRAAGALTHDSALAGEAELSAKAGEEDGGMALFAHADVGQDFGPGWEVWVSLLLVVLGVVAACVIVFLRVLRGTTEVSETRESGPRPTGRLELEELPGEQGDAIFRRFEERSRR